MFAATLIVFRETLEAALFVGIVAAATRQLAGRARWLTGGVGLGVLGSLLLALMAGRIAGAFDGMGQDLLNIGVLTLALAMLLWHCIWVSTHGKEMAAEARSLGQNAQSQHRPWALLVVVMLTVLREGAETVLFVAGSMQGSADTSASTVVLATVVGLTLGAAVGYGIYAGLARIPVRHLFTATNTLIALLAASIASQLARALAQVGWVERWTNPLWDSSAWLATDSTLGTLLHALVGYDPQPSASQLAGYLGALALIYFGTRFMAQRHGRLARH